MTTVQPYLFYNGRCEEALEFYKSALGAQVDFLMRYKESPEPPPPGRVPAGWDNKIMHTTFRVGGNAIMASDGCATTPKFEGFSLALTFPTPAEAEKAFNALSAGGKVEMPLTKTFWSPLFGMLEDKFGMGWMISVEHKQQ